MKPKFASQAFSYSIIAVGAVVCAIAAYNFPHHQFFDWKFLFLAGVTTAFGSRLSFQMPGSKIHFMMGDALVFLTFLLYGGESAILLAAAEAFSTSYQLKRSGVNLKYTTIFSNTGIMASATAATYAFFASYTQITGRIADYDNVSSFVTLLAMLSLVQFFANTALVAVGMSLKTGGNVWRTWYEKCLGGSVTTILGFAFAGIAYKFIQNFDWVGLIGASVAVGLLCLTYRRYTDDIEESMTKAEAAERERAELERQRAEEAEKHVEELSQHIAEQERIGEELRDSRESFRYAALHDALTGLPNRTYFTQELKLMLKRSQYESEFGFCVLFLDLDRFKGINDSLGHSIGDKLLILVARRLEHAIRQGDTVTRLGGDEFAVILNGIGEVNAASAFAERVRESIGQPFQIDGHQVFTATSVGIALNNAEYAQPEDILRDADIAMYHAKENELGSAVFDREWRVSAMNKVKIETDLRYAVEREELRVYYQPIIALESGHLAGFEALMRWQHPERGLVSPAEFIPISENTGMIVPMTIWILQQACLQLSQWRWRSAANRSLLMSVNLSTKHFTHPTLLDDVKDILHESGLDARCLKLEITEGTVMENAEVTTSILQRMRDLGVQLSIDDFGTGYSSLSYLHRFPIDTLKIDRSFVMRMGDNGENAEIVRTIITLAQNLGLEVIAEGVETVEQCRQLQSLGCRYAQGYLFAKPQPAAEIENLMRQRTNWLPADVEPLSIKNTGNLQNVISLR